MLNYCRLFLVQNKTMVQFGEKYICLKVKASSLLYELV